METHITTEVAHYKGECYAWDVVNEPFNSDGSFVSDPFFNAMGSGYIADALRTAHAADPNAKLYLNDFNIEGMNAKSNAMFSLAQSLLAQGVPLNGIGFESHSFSARSRPTCRRTCNGSRTSAWMSRSPSLTTASRSRPPART